MIDAMITLTRNVHINQEPIGAWDCLTKYILQPNIPPTDWIFICKNFTNLLIHSVVICLGWEHFLHFSLFPWTHLIPWKCYENNNNNNNSNKRKENEQNSETLKTARLFCGCVSHEFYFYFIIRHFSFRYTVWLKWEFSYGNATNITSGFCRNIFYIAYIGAPVCVFDLLDTILFRMFWTKGASCRGCMDQPSFRSISKGFPFFQCPTNKFCTPKSSIWWRKHFLLIIITKFLAGLLCASS